MPASSRITRLFEGPFYTEGPAVDGAGSLYFTTLAGGGILRIGQDGVAASWAASACPNGQTVLKDGAHLICNSRSGLLERYDPRGGFLGHQTTPVLAGVRVSCPNDVIEDRQGNVYFTDSIRHQGLVFFSGRRRPSPDCGPGHGLSKRARAFPG